MLLLRWLLLPVSVIYACITWLRNRLYDFGILKSQGFDLPVVVVGNLAVGGTGKSPMTEYILRILAGKSKVAVLSRGYGRKTKGFRYVETSSLTQEVGDEPLQIKRKFPSNTVVVSENRVFAVEKLRPTHDAILLDDAFQHRQLKPSFSILLIDFDSLQRPIISLPTGNFRDSLMESRRANIIVITKSPALVSAQDRFSITARLAQHSKAQVFFSGINYASLLDAFGQKLQLDELSELSVLLLTGIAKPKPLQEFIQSKVASIHAMSYPDHHHFTEKDLQHIQGSFDALSSRNKIILTTEKDFQRLNTDFYTRNPVFYIPITLAIKFEQQQLFESLILKAFAQPQTVN